MGDANVSNLILIITALSNNLEHLSVFNMVVWWRKLDEVESECTLHNFSLFAKNYQNWWKFDERDHFLSYLTVFAQSQDTNKIN